jgi:serine/threonine protein kinase/uncharacterized membrane protein YhaH (DUF805 family)
VLGRVLGRGGFGITYLGWQQMPGRRVAIKEYIPQAVAARVNNGSRVVPSSRKLEPEFQHGLRSFGEEASRLADFQGQPHIVSVFELVPANGTGYMVMEYCPGPTASQYMRMYGGRLSFVDAVDIIGPVLDALTVLHARNVFHRDVSPDNILLTEQGVKLIDFGAARTALAERSVDFSAILKMAFAPPEQYSRRGRQGAWTDVYSAAATIYYLIVGAPAPNAMDRVVHDELQTPSSKGASLPPSAERALMSALALNVDQRTQSARAFKLGLTQIEPSRLAAPPPVPAYQPRAAAPRPRHTAERSAVVLPPVPGPVLPHTAALSRNPFHWYAQVFKQYARFDGRAMRREYWSLVLVNTIVIFVLSIMDALMGLVPRGGGYGLLTSLYLLGSAVPSIAVGVRRMHDTDRSGWWIITPLALIWVFYAGTPGVNQHGPDPKDSGAGLAGA